jgi:hypothetical protein
MRNRDEIILRCLSFREEYRVISVCIDLDIFAEGDTLKESKEKLLDGVSLYVKHAIDEKEVDKLIPRYAPFKYRLIYKFLEILSMVKRIKKYLEKKSFSQFPYQQKLSPAKGTPLFE